MVAVTEVKLGVAEGLNVTVEVPDVTVRFAESETIASAETVIVLVPETTLIRPVPRMAEEEGGADAIVVVLEPEVTVMYWPPTMALGTEELPPGPAATATST